jgi:hypothetical protein
MTSSILMVALLSIPTFLSFSALMRMSEMKEAAASSSRGGFRRKSSAL